MRAITLARIVVSGLLIITPCIAQESALTAPTELTVAANKFLDHWAQSRIVAAATYLSDDAIHSRCTQQVLNAGEAASHAQQVEAFRRYLSRVYMGNVKVRPSANPIVIAPSPSGVGSDHEIYHDSAQSGDYSLVSLQGIDPGKLFACSSDNDWLKDVAASQSLYAQVFLIANGMDSPTPLAVVWHQSKGAWKILVFTRSAAITD